MPYQTQLRSVPAVPVRADRADEEIAVVGPRAAHHIGVEAPAFLGVHHGIDPQRGRRAFASHAVTLSSPTDTDRPRGGLRLSGGRAGQRIARRAGRT